MVEKWKTITISISESNGSLFQKVAEVETLGFQFHKTVYHSLMSICLCFYEQLILHCNNILSLHIS